MLKHTLILFITLLFNFTVTAQTALLTECITLQTTQQGTNAQLSWSVLPGAAFYQLLQNDSSEAFSSNFSLVSGGPNTTSNVPLTIGSNSYFYVVALDSSLTPICRSNQVVQYGNAAGLPLGPTNLLNVDLTDSTLLLFTAGATLPNFSHYEVYVDTFPNPTTLFDTIQNSNQNGLFLTTLLPDVSYFAKVRAIDNSGNTSQFSNEIAFHQDKFGLPSVNNLSYSVNNLALNLQFNSPNYTGTQFQKYVVARGTNPNFLQPYWYGSVNDFSNQNLNFTSHFNNATYYYSVYWLSQSNQASDSVNFSITVIDNVPPAVPQNVSTTPANAALKLNWQAVIDSVNDFNHYKIYIDTVNPPVAVAPNVYGANSTQTVVQNLIQFDTYYVQIASVDNYGNESAKSTVVTGIPTDTVAIVAPADFTASIDSGQTTLSWTSPVLYQNDFSHYRILQGFIPSQIQPVDTITTLSTNSHTVYNLANNANYFFALEVVDSLGNADTSRIVRVIPFNSEQELNEPFFNGNPLKSELIGQIYDYTDDDYFIFSSPTPIQIEVFTQPVPNLDTAIGTQVNNTTLTLYDTNGFSQIAFNNNGFSTGNYSRIFHYIPYGGTFYLRVRGNFVSNTGYYKLVSNLVTPDYLEANNSIYSATPLNDTTLFNDLSIFPLNDVDVFEFQANVNEQVDLNINVPFYIGTIELIDSSNTVISTVQANSANFLIPYTGTFYIRYSISGFTASNYSFDFKIIPPVSYADQLLINEIHYSNPNYQYIELYNRSSQAINLQGFQLPEINYVFSGGTIPANGHITLTNNSLNFSNEYGFAAFDQFSGTIAPTNQSLTVIDTLNQIVDFLVINTQNGWPIATTNYSLEFNDTLLNNSIPSNWHESYFSGGTPNHPNSTVLIYTADSLEPNNTLGNATFLEHNHQMNLSLSELSDTADWFLYRLRQADTLIVTATSSSPTAQFQIQLLDTVSLTSIDSMVLIGTDTNSLTFIAASDTTIALYCKTANDSLQFIINEGFYSLNTTVNVQPIQVGYTQTFDNVLPDDYPAGFRVFDLDENGASLPGNSLLNEGVNNTRCFQFSASGSTQNNDWLLLPEAHIVPNTLLSFLARGTGSPFVEKLAIWVGPANATHPSQCTTFIDSITVSSVNFSAFTFDLDSFQNQNITIALQSTSNNQNILYIENLGLQYPPFYTQVSGVVTHATTGSPLNNVAVQIGSDTTFTNSLGEFSMVNIPYGTNTIQASKLHFSNYSSNIALQAYDTQTVAIQLIPNTIDTIFYTGFENGVASNLLSSNNSFNWYTANQVNLLNDTIYPLAGATALFLGGPQAYGIGTIASYTLQNNPAFALQDYTNIKLHYNYNTNIHISDRLYALALQNTFLDINNNGIQNSNDYISGNSNGWQADSVDLSGLSLFNDVPISFTFVADSFLTAGWGVALDELLILGELPQAKPAPTNLIATSFIQNQVPLIWNAPNTALTIQEYLVFQSTNGTNFNLIGSTTDTTFADTTVQNGTTYFYRVKALYATGASDFSNTELATAGTPTALAIPYANSFDSIQVGSLPAYWNFDLSLLNPWLVGDTNIANTFNNQFGFTNRFVFSNVFTAVNVTPTYQTLLSSPWFNCTTTPTNHAITVRFASSGLSVDEFHVLAYRDGLTANWQPIDTIAPSTNAIWYNYDVTAIANGKNYFQLGFLVQKDSSVVNSSFYRGWAIDNFSISTQITGAIVGTVSSQNGTPLENALVTIESETTENWNTPTTVQVRTNSLGNYTTANQFISYNTQVYKATAEYPLHHAQSFTNVALGNAVSASQNFTLPIDLEPVQNFTVTPNANGDAQLAWQSPKLLGELSYDNGLVGTLQTRTNTQQFGMIVKDQSLDSLRISQLAVYAQGNANADVLFVKLASTGLPNLQDTVAFIPNTSINASAAGWQFINFGSPISVDTNLVYALIQPHSTLQIGYSNFSGGTNSILRDTSSSTFNNLAQAILLRAYQPIGGANSNYTSIQFNGTYSIYQADATYASINNIASNVSNTNYLDASLFLGDSANYFISANYPTLNASVNSDSIGYKKLGVAYLELSNTNHLLEIPFGSSSTSGSTQVKNIGNSPLTVTAQTQLGLGDSSVFALPIYTSQTTVSAAVNAFTNWQPGDTAQMRLNVLNTSTNNASINSIQIQFPVGINVLSTNNLSVNQTSKFLSGTNTMQQLIYSNPTGGNAGIIDGFEAGKATITLGYTSGFAGTPYGVYTLNFSNNQTSTDTLWLAPNSAMVQLSNSSITLLPNDSITLTYTVNQATQHKEDWVPFSLLLNSNSAANSQSIIPVATYAQPTSAALHGVVTDANQGLTISNAIIQINHSTLQFSTQLNSNGSGFFNFDSIPLGDYSILVEHPQFNSFNGTFSLTTAFDTVLLPISLTPRVPNPIHLTATNQNNKALLSWEVEDYELYYNFNQPNGQAPAQILNFTTIDGDGDGVSWEYYNINPFEGTSSVASSQNMGGPTNDWLITPQMRITEQNAFLRFHAAPQDQAVSAEHFLVRISSQTADTNLFTDTLLNHQFPINQGAQWQGFTVDLSNYLNDSIYIAIQCISQNQFKLKVDSFFVKNAQLASEPIDSLNYNFLIYKSINNANYIVTDSVQIQNDTAFYLDQAIQLDTLYTYFVSNKIVGSNFESDFSNTVSFKVQSRDLTVSQLLNPTSNSNLGGTEPIQIVVRNVGVDSISVGDTLHYGVLIDGVSIDSTFAVVNSTLYTNDTLHLQFDSLANLSAEGSYTFKTWVKVFNDNNVVNDTLTKLIQHLPESNEPNWTVNAAAFQFNMSLTAKVFVLDTQSVDTNDILSAWVGNQVRGVTHINYVSFLNDYFAQMSIYANTNNETVYFKFYDASKDSVFDIIETYSFVPNAIVGSLTNYEELHTPSSNLNFDVKLEAILAPTQVSNYSSAELVSIALKNNGTLNLVSGDSIVLWVQSVHSPSGSTQTINETLFLSSTLATNDTLHYHFAQRLNMADSGLYTIRVAASFALDYTQNNDSASIQLNHNPITPPDWTVNPANYQFSAFLTAKLFFNDVISVNPADKVAALINGEVRGSGNVYFNQAFNVWVVQLPIYSNVANGETISFAAYNAAENRVYTVDETFVFSDLQSIGTLVNPERLHADGYLSVEDNEAAKGFIIYPNPAHSSIEIQALSNEFTQLELFNANGAFIQAISMQQSSFNIEHLAKGLYFIKATGNNKVELQKLVVY